MEQAIKGSDVSKFQPKIDYAEMAKLGGRFLYIKGTEGATYVDPLVVSHIHGAYQNNILCGLYHFYHPTRTPESQADNFCKLLELYKNQLFLPPVLDLETDDTIRDENRQLKRPGVPSAQIRDDSRKFCTLVEARSGHAVTLYTYPNFASAHALGSALGASQPLWIAHYGVKTPIIPQGWASAKLWQYTGHGRIHPIAGGTQDADLDVFLGSEDDFSHWYKSL